MCSVCGNQDVTVDSRILRVIIHRGSTVGEECVLRQIKSVQESRVDATPLNDVFPER